MTLSRRCFALAVTLAFLVPVSAHAAVVALKAVQINDEPIGQTDTVNVCPGDTIVAEILLSDWSASGEQLKIWQAELDPQRFASGTAGLVLPLGWDAGLEASECAVDDDCEVGSRCNLPACCLDPPYCTLSFCVGPDHDPEAGAFIDNTRPDYVFTGTVSLPAIDTCTGGKPGYRYGALVFSGAMPTYAAPPKYGGTLILVVSKDASGTFEIGFSPGAGTFMKDENSAAILPLEVQNLTVDVSAGGGPPCRLAESDPPNCAIDSSQPSEPSGAGDTGWDRISLSFDSDASSLTTDDFEVDDLTISPPLIDTLIPSDAGKTLTLVFDRLIRLGRWTCITYLPRNRTTCIGSQPGDIDGDGTTDTTDISLLVEHLSGNADPPLADWQCDIDLSGMCTGADLLRAIDLANGADSYDAWLDRTIFPADCPSAQ